MTLQEVADLALERAAEAEKNGHGVTAECLRSWVAYLKADPDFKLARVVREALK